MKYIQYLNLPKVPEQLIEPLEVIINKPTHNNSLPADYPFFKNKQASNELTEWLRPLFDFEIKPQYQVIYKGLPIHIDKGNRVLAYNYLLDTGGNNVITAIYSNIDNKYKLVQSEILEVNRWHRIDTGMLHGVHGIHPDRIRIALTISSTIYRD